MQYLGGKKMIARPIADFLSAIRAPGQLYLEPFLGSAAVFELMAPPKIGSDAHLDLMLMWAAVRRGWLPPAEISEEMHRLLKNAPASAIRGFAGFACSYGGDWFHGYARHGVSVDRRGRFYRRREKSFALSGKRSLRRKAASMRGALLACADFRALRPRGALVYCDPPYAGTTGYSVPFDHDAFWATMAEWSRTNTVVVSEYRAPSGWREIWSRTRRTGVRTGRGNATSEIRTERLFVLERSL